MYHSKNISIYFGVKRSKIKVTGQGRLHMLKKLFPDENPFLDCSIVFELHSYITHHLGKTPVAFRVRRSKAKVTGQDCIQKCLWITPVRIKEFFQTSSNYHPSPKKNPTDFGFKGSEVEVKGQDCLQICFCIYKKFFFCIDPVFSKNSPI